jgi:hypothetical protein
VDEDVAGLVKFTSVVDVVVSWSETATNKVTRFFSIANAVRDRSMCEDSERLRPSRVPRTVLAHVGIPAVRSVAPALVKGRFPPVYFRPRMSVR